LNSSKVILDKIDETWTEILSAESEKNELLYQYYSSFKKAQNEIEVNTIEEIT